jgi:excisionase family DNA binding protein
MSQHSTSVSREDRRRGASRAKAAATEMEPLLVTVREGLRLTGLGNTKFYELVKDGTIETVKVGRRTLPTYASLKKLATPTEDR